jgi:hypothetical protein
MSNLWSRLSVSCALLAASACGAGGIRGAVPAQAPAARVAARPAGALPAHSVVGFSVDTPQRAATAASQGVTSTILYGESPPAGSPLAKALVQNGIGVVDGGISGEMFYWECHRTHTVAPPPKPYANDYCATDEEPRVNSEAVVLADVAKMAARDARRPYVEGYWVLDDWPWWDAGSGHDLLPKVHAVLAKATPGYPAICGFGAGIGKGPRFYWSAGTAENYSNAGCDAVGWYVYSPFGLRHPSDGKDLNWKMQGLLGAMARSLEKYGWNVAQRPLIGIGQAWSGPYGKNSYQPGLSTAQMQTQAAAFCSFGANSISWYGWDDSGFNAKTQTPNNSTKIAAGIAAGIAACKATWGSQERRRAQLSSRA